MYLPRVIRDRLPSLPLIGELVRDRDQLRELVDELKTRLIAEQRARGHYPPGHFYSPIADVAEVRARRGELFESDAREIAGVELRESEQLGLLAELDPLIREQPFSATPTSAARYHFDNEYFSYADGIMLYAMLRRLRPRRFVEIGSGYSSAVALDVNERYFGGAMQMTFIEPYPDRLLALLRGDDRARINLLAMPLWQVPLDRFTELEANDVLFIDSTHVSKIGSDVNRIFFDILPRLPPGVHVHIHDIFYPFEYPAKWVIDEGRSWNEAYLTRAFLQFNRAFEIVLYNDFLFKKHRAELARRTAELVKNSGGSLWLRRVA